MAGRGSTEEVFTPLILGTGHSGATSQTVATCGGEAVCVIDCQTGIVLHKYKAPGEVSGRQAECWHWRPTLQPQPSWTLFSRARPHIPHLHCSVTMFLSLPRSSSQWPGQP